MCLPIFVLRFNSFDMPPNLCTCNWVVGKQLIHISSIVRRQAIHTHYHCSEKKITVPLFCWQINIMSNCCILCHVHSNWSAESKNQWKDHIHRPSNAASKLCRGIIQLMHWYQREVCKILSLCLLNLEFAIHQLVLKVFFYYRCYDTGSANT